MKLIFIHGVNDQKTNYSQDLFGKILKSLRGKPRCQGKSQAEIDAVARSVTRHEVRWTEQTLDRVNRYLQLQDLNYEKASPIA